MPRRRVVEMSRPTYLVEARREEEWWILIVPELDGITTQTRRLDQADDMVRDLIALWLEVDPDSFDMEIAPNLPGPIGKVVSDAVKSRHTAMVTREKAAVKTGKAIDALVGQGYAIRDVGRLLGISHQRVAQLRKTQ
jgi:predicted RNase H-like HicB family nuclease